MALLSNVNLSPSVKEQDKAKYKYQLSAFVSATCTQTAHLIMYVQTADSK